MVPFDFKSAELNAPGVEERLKQFQERFGKVRPACVRFTVKASAEPQESQASEPRLDVARGEAIKKRLVELGFVADSVTVQASSGQTRDAYVEAGRPPGRLRCDPATKRPSIPAACIGEYGACYYELADGTACNFDGVPDPDPKRYSVILVNQ